MKLWHSRRQLEPASSRPRIGDDVVAFVHGRLAEGWTGRDPLPCWVLVNPLAHGTQDDLAGLVAADAALRHGRHPWAVAQARLARELLDRTRDDEELRRLQSAALWDLESELIDSDGRLIATTSQFFHLVMGALDEVARVPRQPHDQ